MPQLGLSHEDAREYRAWLLRVFAKSDSRFRSPIALSSMPARCCGTLGYLGARIPSKHVYCVYQRELPALTVPAAWHGSTYSHGTYATWLHFRSLSLAAAQIVVASHAREMFRRKFPDRKWMGNAEDVQDNRSKQGTLTRSRTRAS